MNMHDDYDNAAYEPRNYGCVLLRVSRAQAEAADQIVSVLCFCFFLHPKRKGVWTGL